jgi:L-glyceraldehyde 3-phosphate reductase
VVSVLIGASSVAQLEQNVSVLDSPAFSDAELAEIDRLSAEAGIEIP